MGHGRAGTSDASLHSSRGEREENTRFGELCRLKWSPVPASGLAFVQRDCCDPGEVDSKETPL